MLISYAVSASTVSWIFLSEHPRNTFCTMDFEARERERRRLWGPADYKISWTEMCKRLSEADPSWAKEIGGGAPLFMSEQIHKLKLGKVEGGIIFNSTNKGKDLLHNLRPEDAIHIPQLRFDHNSGKIVEWNRSLCDLTGISTAQVVGKLYAEVLDEWLPNLTKEYKEAAVEWVKKEEDNGDKGGFKDDEEGCREDYLFPLPLPIKYDTSFEYVSGNTHYFEYVEILVARSDRLFELYPHLTSYPVIPQCERGGGAMPYRWNFDTSGWVGGVEFTLRRKQYIPSLQMLCKELLPKGCHAFNEDGSLAATKLAAYIAKEKSERKPPLTAISNYIRSCGPVGITYIREVMNAVHKKSRNYGLRVKTFHFSEDWSSNSETSAVHKCVVFVLGGAEQLIKEKIDKGKLVWTLNFEGGENDGEGLSKNQLKILKEEQASKLDQKWNKFKKLMTPVIAENKSFPVTCGASDFTFILPAVNRPERTILTLKIEGHERSDGSYGEEKFKAHSVVQVPASLNLFQLHRVVCLTMNCGAHGRRETHEWRVPNINSSSEKIITDDDVEYVQVGETYFVENGKREDFGIPVEGLFETGGAVRQRVSRTGAFIDQEMPLYPLGFDYDEMFRMKRKRGGLHFDRMKACIHSTCISAVFFQPGTTALLQDGLVKYFTSYKITCTKSEEYAGELPLNPDINIMQPKCLRGKPEEDSGFFSVDRANKLLHSDRGCLRRNLCKVGSNDFLVQMPFCEVDPIPFFGHRREYPVAVQLTGLDHYPMFLYGEPPLPSSGEYKDYVSSLRGKIDPRFLQENVMGNFGGDFKVPFKYGSVGGRRWGIECHESDDVDGNGPDPNPGYVWTDEVDEEMKRIDSLKPKKTAKGKKRKAPTTTSTS